MSETSNALNVFIEPATYQNAGASSSQQDKPLFATLSRNEQENNLISTPLNANALNFNPIDIKNINRKISAKTSQEKYDTLMTERNKLTLKQFAEEGLSKHEKLRLRVVKWEIECIEDAMCGEHLESIEEIILQKEHLAKMLQRFADDTEKVIKSSGKMNSSQRSTRKRR